MSMKEVWQVRVASCKACHGANLAIMLPDVLVVLLAAVLHRFFILCCPLCRLRWDLLRLAAQTPASGYQSAGATRSAPPIRTGKTTWHAFVCFEKTPTVRICQEVDSAIMSNLWNHDHAWYMAVSSPHCLQG